MKTWLWVLACLPGAAPAQQEPLIAITGATVMDGTAEPPREATVIIRGQRIEAVGPRLPVPPGARVIRAKGHTLLPGLFDLHTHLPYSAVAGLSGDWGKILKAYLYCGVTTVVDFGTYPETFEPMRRLLREGVVVGPRVLLAARITTPGGHGAEGGRGDFFSLEVLTPREGRAAMRRWLAYRPDAIKVFTDGWRYGTAPDMTSMDEATLAAIVAEAHQARVPVLTHTVTLEKAKTAARARVDVIGHGVGNAPVDDELVRLMKAHGTTYVSTLAVYEPRGRDGLDPLLATVLEPAAQAVVARPFRAEPGPARAQRWNNLMANTAALRSAGVRIGVGTDAGVTGTYHGWATLRELKLLVAGGLPPQAALVAATSKSAEAIYAGEERGTIAPGKLADLVLVEGAPHRTIEDLDRIRRVFLGGKEIEREVLAREIGAADMTPLPPRPAQELVDDFERDDGRTALGTLRVNSTDTGNDHSRMLFTRTKRSPAGHALTVLARMAEKDQPFARLDLLLSPGAVEPVDASQFTGISFQARGEGSYRLLVPTRAVRDSAHFAAPFEASAEWRTVTIPFIALRQERPRRPVAWRGTDLLMLQFEIARAPGADGWLELDNVRFYK